MLRLTLNPRRRCRRACNADILHWLTRFHSGRRPLHPLSWRDCQSRSILGGVTARVLILDPCNITGPAKAEFVHHYSSTFLACRPNRASSLITSRPLILRQGSGARSAISPNLVRRLNPYNRLPDVYAHRQLRFGGTSQERTAYEQSRHPHTRLWDRACGVYVPW